MLDSDADDSDSSGAANQSDPHRGTLRVPQRRSATVSPLVNSRTHHRSRSRRKSDINLSERKRYRIVKIPSDSRRHSERSDALRKTNSEPSVEQAQQAHVDAIRQLLDTFPVRSVCDQSASAHDIWMTPRQSLATEQTVTDGNDIDDDIMVDTEIEELKVAAESIQSLQRVLKRPPDLEPPSVATIVDHHTVDDTESDNSRRSGITTRRVGLPRGVIQFIPSVKETKLINALDTYMGKKNNQIGEREKSYPLRRKTSLPETCITYSPAYSVPCEQSASRQATSLSG
ncbi:hypothetical protein AB6A40_002187 [Gnathostoma spinigerum]|uniref:Uncharacterized protein n=1 Tax=Gnathostoma spinigerum TaxID=75299 RepID=A0ABD6EF12_9BILA